LGLLFFDPELEVKGYVDVFIDVNSTFCRKLHNEFVPNFL